ncbi:RNA polymerase sigma factor [Caulobacter segnis]|uniref:RNA polymerase, sigma-24 subunit, ECF subfamily n=2 Tax=Caulobacter segnis TaxID=88688 RepID=D5VEI2_CAUST|nr:RNA polymerase sigma factor [Caulobacter segnis]ADG09125.1 RNA polymerase, sigma-24 subunit, ECF subfamily [Caulobacter segnis ATCC 21756]AVQ00945.1 RNA polymerase sigma factor [Caulobacter segnis]
MSRDIDKDFADWLAPHLSMLYRTARAFADPADHSDLLQEMILALWKARPRFRAESATGTFAHRVAHNAALTWRRGEARRRLRGVAIEAELVKREAGTDPQGELLERLYAAIRQLPPVDRSLILLSLDGLSYAEIARLHGLSETNVGARLTRIRQRVASLVEEADHGV